MLYPANLEVPVPARTQTLDDVLNRMKAELDNNYAKFGGEDAAIQRQNIQELIDLLESIKE